MKSSTSEESLPSLPLSSPLFGRSDIMIAKRLLPLDQLEDRLVWPFSLITSLSLEVRKLFPSPLGRVGRDLFCHVVSSIRRDRIGRLVLPVFFDAEEAFLARPFFIFLLRRSKKGEATLFPSSQDGSYSGCGVFSNFVPLAILFCC